MTCFLRRIALCLFPLLADSVRAEEPVRVTVVVILASEKHQEVSDKIKEVADEVKKNHPSLTGFKLSKTLSESVEKGKSHSFKLPGDAKLEVSVHSNSESPSCTTLTIKPPTLGEITYNCKCGKYFPVITKFQPDKDSDERLILAIMAKPCSGGK